MKKIALLSGLVFLLGGAVRLESADIALLDSANTKEFFLRHYDVCNYLRHGEEYQRYFRGWEYLLGQNYAGRYQIIHDQDVTAAALTNFRVLILSNTASLSEAQSTAIQQWVIRGGHLLATFGSGYKSTIYDPKEADLLKKQKGHTFGLHELWHDPASTLFGTYSLDPSAAADIRITRFEGPTACSPLESSLEPGGILPYGAEGNLMIQRPESHPGVLAFLKVLNAEWDRSSPAILSTGIGKGLVVYYAFAPEYIVSLARLTIPNPDSTCQLGFNPADFEARAVKALTLMQCTLDYLLNN